MENNKEKKVSWNASAGLIQEISNKRSQANNLFISGDIAKAFKALVSIKQSVIQSFNTTEREALDKIEQKFGGLNSALSTNARMSFNPNVKKAHGLAFNLATKFYSEFNDKLMDLLEARGYLIAGDVDVSQMQF